MTRNEVLSYVKDTYGTIPDYPWPDLPGHAVLRHKKNQKWYGLLMNVPRNKIGLEGESPADILNLKSDPILIGSLRHQEGIYPAYHMNKEHWFTVLLGSSFPDDELLNLIDMSYSFTAPQ